MTTPLIEAIASAIQGELNRQVRALELHDSYADQDAKIAGAILTAITEAGYVICPREPTQDMISAGIIERHEQPTPEAWSLATENIYRAMISAAQGDG